MADEDVADEPDALTTLARVVESQQRQIEILTKSLLEQSTAKFRRNPIENAKEDEFRAVITHVQDQVDQALALAMKANEESMGTQSVQAKLALVKKELKTLGNKYTELEKSVNAAKSIAET
ncbi:hypothetical protein N656DRAFT_795063 [Canariomyces notabilis]|uniref:Uncharacterized protein n=1 Tax=Canariomyces notabilis TaxID=2074819 RepID=A0AAN6YXV8_9PEZI|nr:hypothetical protein N656DRAFT_795063 [Canariomyces arenarius]